MDFSYLFFLTGSFKVWNAIVTVFVKYLRSYKQFSDQLILSLMMEL